MGRRESPLDPSAGPVEEFAQTLRNLRAAAGRPGYRELARRAGFSAAALAAAARGEQLPSQAVTLAFAQACGGDRTEWEQRWRLAAAAVTMQEEEEGAGDVTSPYLGLAAYQQADAGWFFGRERLVDDLLRQLAADRLVAVLGSSGSGKSSLLHAGVAARAVGHGLPGLAGRVRAVMLTPGADPMRSFTHAVLQASGRRATPSADAPEPDITEAAQTLERTPHLGDGQADGDLLVVVDQFEEVFTQCAAPDARKRFIDLLVSARRPGSRVRVLLGIRADFFARCAEHRVLAEALREATVLVTPMTAADLRDVIVKPAALRRVTVEPALVATVIAEAAGQPGVLPLVSHALRETWRRRRGKAMTLHAYQAAGGIDGAIARTADHFYAALPAPHQDIARRILLRLIAVGDGRRATHRPLPRADLDGNGHSAETEVVVGRLAAARLVTVDDDSVQLGHESLIDAWPRLQRWVQEDRDGLRIHQQLTDAAKTWHGLGRDPGALYRGARLALAEDWAGTHEPHLTSEERAFLTASIAAQAEEAAVTRRRALRLRHLVLVLTALSVTTTVTTVSAVRAQHTITRQRNAALAQNVAADVLASQNSDRPLAVQLGLAAYRMAPTVQTRNSLLSALTPPRIRHAKEITSIALSLDGRTLATGSGDRTIRLFDLTDHRRPVELARLPTHTDGVFLALSPDGRTLAAGSWRTLGSGNWDRTARLWDITDRRHPAHVVTLPGHTETVDSVAFSPDGRLLATGSGDHTTRLWRIDPQRHPTHLATLTSHADGVYTVAFSPDGRMLATGGNDDTVRVWKINDPAHPVESAVLTDHTDAVESVAFSPDGRLLATGGDDHTTRLWRLDPPRLPARLATLTSHTDGVYHVAFSPDGHTLTTAGDDRTTRLFDITDPARPVELAVFSGHTNAVTSAAFTPDGRTVITGSWDGTSQFIDTDLHRTLTRACDHARPTITRAQWDRYLPHLPYRPPCP
ncbi:WD40 repeat domain-containing protein [Actinomadura graeca]|uniref:WD40 repeat domain-containing protein n=1 Tax=Actinomadura graeca TaxID=2750812 RepID=A0ABX8QTW6_9ACTN|nr:WD40 repeat domain-containing protein [Actinomadura graeca]QXJ22270.1 WD40 repeat domain-containing protein [Actinomadura graeca]